MWCLRLARRVTPTSVKPRSRLGIEACCADLANVVCFSTRFFIARQHAERDIVLPILSVCPFSAGIVSKRIDITPQFFDGLI